MKIGAEGRITVDYDTRAIAGYVSFVSPKLQYAQAGRDQKRARKADVPCQNSATPELVSQHIERIKTGIRGVGYVKVPESAVWPARLQHLFGPQAEAPLTE